MTLKLLEDICKKSELGYLEETPTSLTGGLMHKMYLLPTSTGRYVVKLLNPYIMQRETAKHNFEVADTLELILEENNFPIIPAIIIHEKKMQLLDGQYFYIYKWFDGHVLKKQEITEMHCSSLGKVLAKIHNIDKKNSSTIEPQNCIDWDHYINLLSQSNNELHSLLEENKSLLYETESKSRIALTKLPLVSAICHNDLDCKNVLWKDSNYQIIDLETLSYANPFLELYQTALSWSGYEEKNINYHLLSSFITSYVEANGELPQNWETISNIKNGELGWLEYNIKRALGIDCSEEEITLGISEVKKTLDQIIYYQEIKTPMLDCLENIKILFT
ncbi:phosphotransferase [Vagococcus fluvialis]|uniref:phosphotransferase n=1 Tax=Vagococcus fluvialis TaxID=2738 RepID=UPI001A8E448C|nr:phosphotransferase [Vagococcus fluvialis]MBO0428326.1 phosphotransferase [Vagococcus fluvialis]